MADHDHSYGRRKHVRVIVLKVRERREGVRVSKLTIPSSRLDPSDGPCVIFIVTKGPN